LLESGNATTAADMLHVSQPTVSVNLRRLEQEHGVQLLKRSSRGVQLTDFGNVLYEHAKVMARLDDHAAAQIQMLKASNHKTMRIGTGSAWWSIFMREILSTYQRDHAGVQRMLTSAAALMGCATCCQATLAVSSALRSRSSMTEWSFCSNISSL